MATDSSLVICPENHPDRCTTITQKGQCNNLSRPGTKACPMHSRAVGSLQQRKNITELYEFKHSQEVKNFANAGVMSLKAEVSVVRMCLNQLLKTCDDQNKIILNLGPITKLTTTIASILSTMDHINMNSGNLLDADDIIAIAQEIVQAISLEVEDPAILARLSDRILKIVVSKFSEDQLEEIVT